MAGLLRYQIRPAVTMAVEAYHLDIRTSRCMFYRTTIAYRPAAASPTVAIGRATGRRHCPLRREWERDLRQEGLRATPPNCVTSTISPISMTSGRHREPVTIPGSTRALPSE